MLGVRDLQRIGVGVLIAAQIGGGCILLHRVHAEDVGEEGDAFVANRRIQLNRRQLGDFEQGFGWRRGGVKH